MSHLQAEVLGASASPTVFLLPSAKGSSIMRNTEGGAMPMSPGGEF